MADLVARKRVCHALERPGDTGLAEIAAKQWGVVSRQQLHALGLGRGAIGHRLRTARLHRLHPGVYAVGHTHVAQRGRWLAAVLAYGTGAALSHLDAAALYELRRRHAGKVHVTVPGRRGHSQGEIVVHSVRHLHRDDVTIRDGIPVTSVGRTLLYLAEVVAGSELRRALQSAERLQLFDLAAMTSLLHRSRGRRGLKPLGAALAEFAGPPPITRSELEEIFIDFVRAHDLRPPAMNALVEGYEVDAFWPEHRLVVELDSRGFHDNAVAFEEDRARDTRLQVAGYRVLRITYRRMIERPAEVARTIRALTEAFSAPASPSRRARSG
jgi:very-short-patch-repair endonuclease